MLYFDRLVIGYIDNIQEYMSDREVDTIFHEDDKVIDWEDYDPILDDYIIDLEGRNLSFECAKVYIAVSKSELPDNCYEDTSDTEKIRSDITARAAYREFHRRFPGSVKPMVILKLFHVTKQR